jgi:hypothetical protein
MAGRRKRHSAAFKARVTVKAAKQTRTLAVLSKAFQVHPVQMSQRNKHLLDGVESLFSYAARGAPGVLTAEVLLDHRPIPRRAGRRPGLGLPSLASRRGRGR